MLSDKRIRNIIDYQDSRDCFPGVDIAGGVCYFLWDRDNPSSKCSVRHIESGITASAERVLDEFPLFIFIKIRDCSVIAEKILVRNYKS